MLKIKEAVIVEGKYDKIKLQGLIDAPVIETNGFRVFNDKEKRNLIRRIADKRGVLIMTDSDSAGFLIRNFLKGSVAKEKIKHCYIPEIKGKEKRKAQPSCQGLLGVEGVTDDVILQAVRRSGATVLGEETKPIHTEITKQTLYELGLSGGENAKQLRTRLLQSQNLPVYMTANAMVSALNCLFTKEELKTEMEKLKNK